MYNSPPLRFLAFLLVAGYCSTRELFRKKITTTTTEVPTPYQFEYSAGRAPGGKPDRYVEQEGDAYGNIRGSYTYLDPNWKWQRVNYEASEENGFQILPGSTIPLNDNPEALLPKDTVAVQQAKAQHEALYHEIAASHQNIPVPHVRQSIPQSKAVQQKRYEHESEYQRIAAEHARIEAEHAALAAEDARIEAELADRRAKEGNQKREFYQ